VALLGKLDFFGGVFRALTAAKRFDEPGTISNTLPNNTSLVSRP